MRAGVFRIICCFLVLFFCAPLVSAGTKTAPVGSGTPQAPPDSSLDSSAVSGTPQTDQETEMTDIIDIKPVEQIGYDTRMIRYIFYAIAVLLLVVFLFYLLDRLIRKRKKAGTETEVILPPDQVALKSLADLETVDNLEEKEFYFRLTAIVRAYIKGRFSIDASEMTTEEFLPLVPSLPVEKEMRTGLRDLLKTTDPVKFAGIPAGREKMMDDMRFAKHFVESTRVIPENKEKNE